MNYIDIIIIIPLLYAIYKGYTKGFVIEVATLIALILGIFLAVNYSEYAKNILVNKLDIHSSYMSFIAFIATFIVVVVAINLIGKLLSKFVHAISLGLVNRLLGSLFSLAKVLIILCIIISLFESLDKKTKVTRQSDKNESKLYYPIYNFANGLYTSINFTNLSNSIKNKI